MQTYRVPTENLRTKLWHPEQISPLKGQPSALFGLRGLSLTNRLLGYEETTSHQTYLFYVSELANLVKENAGDKIRIGEPGAEAAFFRELGELKGALRYKNSHHAQSLRNSMLEGEYNGMNFALLALDIASELGFLGFKAMYSAGEFGIVANEFVFSIENGHCCAMRESGAIYPKMDLIEPAALACLQAGQYAFQLDDAISETRMKQRISAMAFYSEGLESQPGCRLLHFSRVMHGDSLAMALRMHGKKSEAIQLCYQIISSKQELKSGDSEELINAHLRLGLMEADTESRENHLLHALELIEPAMKLENVQSMQFILNGLQKKQAIALCEIGKIFASQNRKAEASSFFEKSIAILGSLATGDDKDNVQWLYYRVDALDELSKVSPEEQKAGIKGRIEEDKKTVYDACTKFNIQPAFFAFW